MNNEGKVNERIDFLEMPEVVRKRTGLCYKPLLVGVDSDIDLIYDGIHEGIKSGILSDGEIQHMMKYYAALITLKADMSYADQVSEGIPELLKKLDIIQEAWKKKEEDGTEHE